MEDTEEEEKPDYITASLSLTVSLDQCAEVWMTEEEIKMCFDYANKDFDRFLSSQGQQLETGAAGNNSVFDAADAILKGH